MITTSAINSLSQTAWKNLIDSGKLYDETTVQNVEKAAKIESFASKLLIPPVLGCIASIIAVSSLSIAKALRPAQKIQINRNLLLPLLALVVIVEIIPCLAGLILLVKNTRPDDLDTKLKDISNGKVIEKALASCNTSKERLEALAKALEANPTSKIDAIFFRTLANHEELKSKRVHDLYNLYMVQKNVVGYRKTQPAFILGQPNMSDKINAFCLDLEKELVKV